MISIPLFANGTKIGFESRVPTLEELNNIPDSQRIQLTSQHPWNPSTVQLSETNSCELAQPDGRNTAEELLEYSEDSDSVLMASVQDSICLPTLKNKIISTVKVKSCGIKRKIDQVDVPARRTMVSTERHIKLKAAEIGEFWAIGPQRAKDTLKATATNGI